jgi:predicted acetyltransferase
VEYRPFEEARDLQAVQRIWREVGWIDSDAHAESLKGFLSVGHSLVAAIDGEAECLVHCTPGTMRYQSEKLELAAVTAVTTSRIARKQGFAGRLTAEALARDAKNGFEVSALGMFEQGFYDKVGFGTGSYEQWIVFDPASLTVERSFRVPERLTKDDWQDVHTALLQRKPGHGGCCLAPPEIVKAEMEWTENGFGLGYRDGPSTALTHFIWCSSKGNHGPYTIRASAHQTGDQLLELLALVKSLGDQVSSIGMLEIGDVQLQDLLEQPMRHRRTTAKSEHENLSHSLAYWQLRILDLEACLAKTHLDTPRLRFNLKLSDPLENFLDAGSNWHGIAGDYVVTLGAESSATRGTEKNLETLEASVNAFSRLWFGIRPASSLAITDDLRGAQSLLDELDQTLRLPKAHLGWDF